jgi:TolA-binding protein
MTMTFSRITTLLLLAALLVGSDSCSRRASRSKTTAKKTAPTQQAATTTSAAKVMSRADSVLAKVSAMSAEDLDVASVKSEDYPRTPWGANYVPRPDLTAYSNYEAALAAYNGGDYDKAVGLLSQIAVSGRPAELVPNAYYWMGESYYALGRYADALPYFEYTTKAGPTYKREMAFYKLARANYTIGNVQAASMWNERLRAEYPSTKYAKTLKKIGVQ